jgi:hypothetical protein
MEYVLDALRKGLAIKDKDLLKYTEVYNQRQKESLAAWEFVVKAQNEREEIIKAINILTVTEARDDE